MINDACAQTFEYFLRYFS